MNFKNSQNHQKSFKISNFCFAVKVQTLKILILEMRVHLIARTHGYMLFLCILYFVNVLGEYVIFENQLEKILISLKSRVFIQI